MKKLFTLTILSFLLLACKEENDLSTEANMRVNYYTVECTGEMTSQCLLVQEGDKIGSDDWAYFYYYQSIEGFDYEPGFVYDLKVRKTKIKNPPQDASSIKYELIEIVKKDVVTQ